MPAERLATCEEASRSGSGHGSGTGSSGTGGSGPRYGLLHARAGPYAGCVFLVDPSLNAKGAFQRSYLDPKAMVVSGNVVGRSRNCRVSMLHDCEM